MTMTVQDTHLALMSVWKENKKAQEETRMKIEDATTLVDESATASEKSQLAWKEVERSDITASKKLEEEMEDDRAGLESAKAELDRYEEELSVLTRLGDMTLGVMDATNRSPKEKEEARSKDACRSDCRTLEMAVVKFDGKDKSYATTSNFLQAIGDWMEMKGADDATTSKLIRSKVAGPALLAFNSALDRGDITDLATWKTWFTKRYRPNDNSTTSRQLLDKATQYPNHPNVDSYYNALLEFNCQIKPYDLQEIKLQERFVEGVDREISSDLTVKYKDKLEEGRELGILTGLVSESWLLNAAQNLEEAHQKKKRSQDAYKKKEAWKRRPDASVNAIQVPAGAQTTRVPGVPEFALVKPINDAARDWLRTNGHCFYCRKHGHETYQCPEYLARHPTVSDFTTAPSSISNLVVIPDPARCERGSSSNKSVSFSPTVLYSAVCKPDIKSLPNAGGLATALVIVRDSEITDPTYQSSSAPICQTLENPPEVVYSDLYKPDIRSLPNAGGLAPASVIVRDSEITDSTYQSSSVPICQTLENPPIKPDEESDDYEDGVTHLEEKPFREHPEGDALLEGPFPLKMDTPAFINKMPMPTTPRPMDIPALIDDRDDVDDPIISPATVDIDTTPMPIFSKASDRKMFNCTLRATQGKSNPTIPSTMFLDGGSDANMMRMDFALLHKFPIESCAKRIVKGFDGSPRIINQQCTVAFRLGNFSKKVTFTICPIGNPDIDIILGVPFYQIIRVTNEDWKNHRFQFVSKNGTKHMWYGKSHKYKPDNNPLVYFCGASNFKSTPADQIWSVNIMDMIDKKVLPIQTREDDGITTNTGAARGKDRMSSFTGTIYYEDDSISRSSSSQISSANVDAPQPAPPEPLSNEELAEECLKTLKPELEKILRPFKDSVLSDPPPYKEIPIRPGIDMDIPLKPDSKIPNPGLRRFSDAENNSIREKLKDLLKREFIQPSKSQFGANLLFTKKDGGLRMCIDYRAINAATVKDRTPLPSHVELRESIKGSKFLSKLDVRDAFHMIRISSADCHKTAFKTKWGLFEYTVCPFGLANSPATFMRLMNRIFFDMMGVMMIFYVDDILIYSSTYEQHLLDIAKVLERLKEHNLHVKISKCVFAVSELEFCGMRVSSEGFAIQESQVDAMCRYPDLPSRDRKAVTKYVQQFLGSVRFFADFIPWIGELALPLYELTSKDCTRDWNINHQMTIRAIQHALSTAPVLSFFDPSRPETHVYSDASNFAIGGWISQVDSMGKTHIISYWSRKLIPAETRYTVHEREFLGLHDMIVKFRMFLHGIPFTAHVDHRAMEHLQTQPNLSPRQARWLVYLQEFEFTIEYITGESNTFADWLSRRPDFIANHCDECHKMLVGKLEKRVPETVALVNAIHSSLPLVGSVSADPAILQMEQSEDPFCQQLDLWNDDKSSIPASRVGFFKPFTKGLDGIWKRKDAYVVPFASKLSFLEHFHDRVDHGHFGFYKTMSTMEPVVYWETMAEDIKLFIKSCPTCQHVKSPNHSPYGTLSPTDDLPDHRFESLNLDFAPMPPSHEGFDYLLIIRDRFSKLISAIPTTQNLTAFGCAELLYERWYLSGKGFPTSIISDRDKLFVSQVWTRFCELSGIDRKMSTARHQQTNGGAESAVKIVKQILTGSVNYKKSDWTELLDSALFAYNNSTHPATGYTPFYLAYAFQPSHFPLVIGTDKLAKSFQQYRNNLDHAHENIYRARVSMENSYNKRRTTSFTIAPGSFVLLDREGIKYSPDDQRSKMLLERYLGPFKVLAVDNKRNNVTLDLPPHMRCHNEFHVSLLKKSFQPDEFFPKRDSPQPLVPACTKDGHNEYEVDRILDSRTFGRWKKRQFLIRWKNTSDSENTWEPEEFLTTCPEILEEYLLSLSPVRSYRSRGGVVKEARHTDVSACLMLSVT